MNLFEKLTIAGLAVVAAGSVAGITTTTIIDKKNVEEMNANLLEQINDLQDQINNLNDKTDDLQRQIDELKEEYSALKAKEQADIEAVTNDYTNKIAAIQEQIDNLYNYLADLENDYNEKLADLTDELERVEREYKQADDSNKATLEARITTINNTIYELNSKYQDEVAAINNKIVSLTNNINDLEKELDDAIEAIKAEYDAKLKEIEDRLAELESKKYYTVAFRDDELNKIVHTENVEEGTTVDFYHYEEFGDDGIGWYTAYWDVSDYSSHWNFDTVVYSDMVLIASKTYSEYKRESVTQYLYGSSNDPAKNCSSTSRLENNFTDATYYDGKDWYMFFNTHAKVDSIILWITVAKYGVVYNIEDTLEYINLDLTSSNIATEIIYCGSSSQPLNRITITFSEPIFMKLLYLIIKDSRYVVWSQTSGTQIVTV